MKKTSILALVTASALVLGGCGIFNPMKLTPPELPSGQAVETPSDEGKGGEPVITTANLKPVEYEYDFDAHNPEDWQKAYKKFLEEEVLGTVDEDFFNTEEYFLVDIDDTYNQNIPELCIKTGTCEADYQLVIFEYDSSKGEVKQLVGPDNIYAGHATFYQGPSGDLYSYAGHMGYLSVYKYTELASGTPKPESVFTQNVNPEDGEGEIEDYKTMTEIIGDEMHPLVTFALDNYAGIIWYLNIPYATADGTAKQEEADQAFSDALYGNIDVFATGDRFYDGVRGKTKLENLLKAGGIDSYSKEHYSLYQYTYTDANFDGQQEMLILLKSDSASETGGWVYVLLSYQEGGVFAYVMPYIDWSGNLTVCAYSAWDNWYSQSSRYYTGIVFDKDKMAYIYSDGTAPAPKDVETEVWNDFENDFGY